ncbi:MAG: hypothetical protein KatS3mg105_3246 [Gemmatales bacterium]|nr:MAG: hypothetical protein KatS3mg105_3246 [Gemmatales bacterium]
MYITLPKRVRSLLRRLAETAYERELHRLLDELENSSTRWRRGEIDTLILAEHVDRFANGPERRRLEQRYKTTRMVHMIVAQSIVQGILRKDEVPDEVLDALAKPIEFYQRDSADETIGFEQEDG